MVLYRISIIYKEDCPNKKIIEYIFQNTDELDFSGKYLCLTVKKHSFKLLTDNKKLTEIVTENVRKSKRMLEVIDTERFNKHRR